MEGISIHKTPEYYLYLELRKKYEKVYQELKGE